MFDLETVALFGNRDDVKPHVDVQIVGDHIFVDRFDEQLDFFGFDEILRQSKIDRAARLDLNDGQYIFFGRDDVDLGFLEHPIGFEDPIAVLAQELGGHFFAQFTEFIVFSHWILEFGFCTRTAGELNDANQVNLEFGTWNLEFPKAIRT